MQALNNTYDRLIPHRERLNLERALRMEDGYVLNFSNKTFDSFFFETANVDPSTHSSLFNGRGTSKANRLRSFIESAQFSMVAKVLRALWEHRAAEIWRDETHDEEQIRKLYFSTVALFEGQADQIDISGIEAFEPSETLEELIASIRRDLDAAKPHTALDRLHTYCMKRFAALVRKHGGPECGKDDPLHSRVGRYVRLLQQKHDLTVLSERIVKSSISIFEAMNSIRNDHSLAHDNEKLVGMDEARFIFDSITAFLRFSKSIEGRVFED